MSYGRDLIYLYDGSFEGLLTAVFDSYLYRDDPIAIECTENGQMSIGAQYRHIETDTEKARRVADKIISCAGAKAYKLMYYTYLSELADREINIAGFVKMCLKRGRSAERYITVDCVDFVLSAAYATGQEAHKYTGFVRFSELEGGILYGEIEPVRNVLPILANHFVKRFSSLAFVLHDTKRRAAIIYNGRECAIHDTGGLPSLTYSEDEQLYRDLWKQFYNTVKISGRHNEKCRMTLMPKRYWRHLTEFDETRIKTAKPDGQAQKPHAYRHSLPNASSAHDLS